MHDRDGIFSREVDAFTTACDVAPIRTPPRSPKANAHCERLIGTMRRECLDWFVPMSEGHVLRLVREWAMHYNHGRPHSHVGDVPERLVERPPASGHALPVGVHVVATPVLGGLHHEYALQRAA